MAHFPEFPRQDPQPESHSMISHHPGMGATEEQVNLRAMVPQRTDKLGTKVEDLAGTGQQDALGG